ncbi:hypothetical protein EV426DRAFT_254024 [Tirmania nivea]|nr:hypothetical protein EV426DRAFT_254024 [Tirmania nivea]
MSPILPPYPSPWDSSTTTVPTDANPTPPQTRYYYFAYGSNLWLEQMHYRCPEYTYSGRGVLRGYRWVISKRGYANVIPSGDEIEEENPDELDSYGVVYTLTKSDITTLDMYEGVDKKPVPSYLKVTMGIEMYEKGEGVELPCLVYIDPRIELGKVREEYIGRINCGLKDAGLPEAWVEKVIRKWIPKGVVVEELEEESETGHGLEMEVL